MTKEISLILSSIAIVISFIAIFRQIVIEIATAKIVNSFLFYLKQFDKEG